MKNPTQQEVETRLGGENLHAVPPIFAGDTFPAIDFAKKEQIARDLGPYRLEIRYFSGDLAEVKQPAGPGRYGALVTVRFSGGASVTRKVTLVRAARDCVSAADLLAGLQRAPAAFGLPPQILQDEVWNVGLFEGIAARGDLNAGPAAFLASLQDIARDPAQLHGFAYIGIDFGWWAALERKLGLFVSYPQLVRLPAGYASEPDKKWPLLLFLHGAGERGSDLTRLQHWGPLGYLAAGHAIPAIVVAPQCPQRGWWDSALLSALVDDMEKKYRVDASRIYLTGLSMGGFGSLDLAAREPGRFAAVASLSAGENPALAARLQGVPVWFFHGTSDTVVPALFSINLCDALQKAGSPAKITLLPGVGHGGWDKIYNDPALYAWMLQQSLQR
jgi:predicted esterase